MIFRSVRHALRWYARAVHHDGCKSIWPDPSKVNIPNGARNGSCWTFWTMWAIWRALGTLTASQQRLLALYYVEEIPVLDIAARWDRHPSRVYRLVARAEQVLAERLREEELLRPKQEIVMIFN